MRIGKMRLPDLVQVPLLTIHDKGVDEQVREERNTSYFGFQIQQLV